MSNEKQSKISRRDLLKSSLLIPLAAVAPAFLVEKEARAGSKASKATMMYQDKPHGKDDCSNCVHFKPGKNAHAMGTCAVVAGEISPRGWCVAYTRTSKSNG